MPTRQPYSGTQRKLVLAFDVGTTYSGISYSVLDPGLVPQVRGVTRFPAQAHVGGDSKIPSILWYDAQGTARAMGAEALQDHVLETAKREKWAIVQWWKLHLRPKSLASQSEFANEGLPPLPANKSAVEVLADFMRYLHQCARTYIQKAHSQVFWTSVENQTDFVLTHPNGWEAAQQSEIRRAAVLAGLVPDTDASQSRIQLVTEGEAGLHYCIWNGLTAGTMASGQGVIVVDAGGGTIDLSAYYMSPSSDYLEEIAPTECLVQGSVLVTRRAGQLIADKLRGSKYENPEAIAHITGCFDKTTKLRFRNPAEPSYIMFGSMLDKDADFNITSGRLKLLGSEVEALFEPSIQAIIKAIEAQRRAAHETISSIFLIGGFAASDWLFKKLEEYFLPRGIVFSSPDGHANKAVADGAVSFYLDRRVSARISRLTCGIPCNRYYDPEQPEHVTRANTVISRPSGVRVVPNGFSTIITKGTKVSEDTEFRSKCTRQHKDVAGCNSITKHITCYRGDKQDPKWMDIERAMYSILCTVTADTSQMAKGLKSSHGPGEEVYWRQDYSIVLLFGLTELKAQISWIEGGEEKRGPAKVFYDI